jgi:hypothetical protein
MMNSMIRNPLLRASNILEHFLSDPSEQLNKIKSIVKSLPKPTKVSEFTSLDGVAVCDLNSSSDSFYRINEYLNLSQIVKHKIKRATDDVKKAHLLLATCLTNLSDLFIQLEETQQLLIEQRVPNITLSRGLQDVLKNLARFEQEKAKRFDEYFTMFYKFNYCELDSLKNLLKEREAFSTSFRKAEDKLRTKKLNLWTEGNVSKWDLPQGVDADLIRQDKDAALALMMHSKNTNVKDHFGYYTSSCQSEVDRVMLDNTFIENRHFSALADIEAEARVAESEMWKEFDSKLTVCLEEGIPTPVFVLGLAI